MKIKKLEIRIKCPVCFDKMSMVQVIPESQQVSARVDIVALTKRDMRERVAGELHDHLIDKHAAPVWDDRAKFIRLMAKLITVSEEDVDTNNSVKKEETYEEEALSQV